MRIKKYCAGLVGAKLLLYEATCTATKSPALMGMGFSPIFWLMESATVPQKCVVMIPMSVDILMVNISLGFVSAITCAKSVPSMIKGRCKYVAAYSNAASLDLKIRVLFLGRFLKKLNIDK